MFFHNSVKVGSYGIVRNYGSYRLQISIESVNNMDTRSTSVANKQAEA